MVQNIDISQEDIDILGSISINPHSSTRAIAQKMGISKSTVHRKLKKYKYHPYRVTLVQSLKPTDYQRRLTFIAKIAKS